MDMPNRLKQQNETSIKKINVEKKHKAAQHLYGYKVYSAFRASGCQSKRPFREFFVAKVFII